MFSPVNPPGLSLVESTIGLQQNPVDSSGLQQNPADSVLGIKEDTIKTQYGAGQWMNKLLICIL